MNRLLIAVCIAVMAGALALAAQPTPEQPVGWRYDGTGQFPDTDPVTTCDPVTGQNILWKVKIPDYYGWGNAQPIVVGNKVFVTHEPDYLVCLNADTGEILWRKSINLLYTLQGEEAARYWALWEQKQANDKIWLPLRDQINAVNAELKKDPENAALKAKLAALNEHIEEPRRLGGEAHQQLLPKIHYNGVPWKTLMGYTFATPITDGTYIYMKVATGAVAAVDLDGNVAWMREFPYNGGHSSVASPRLVAGKLIISRPAPATEALKDPMMLTALDAATGKTLWETPALRKGQDDGCASPLPMRLAGTDVLVTAGGDVVRATDGALLAREVCTNTYCSTAFHGDVVFFCHDRGVEAVRLALTAPDKVEATSLWKTVPELTESPVGKNSSMYGGPVYCDGYLHIFQDWGQYFVLDAKDGAVVHAAVALTPKPGEKKVATYANVSAAGGHIYAIDQAQGRMVCFTPGPTGEILGRSNPMGEGTSSPFFQGNRIYVRTLDYVYCLGAK